MSTFMRFKRRTSPTLWPARLSLWSLLGLALAAGAPARAVEGPAVDAGSAQISVDDQGRSARSASAADPAPEDLRPKPAEDQSAAPRPPPAPERLNLHAVATFATQYHPSFPAKYSGANSMQPDAESATAFVASLGMDLRLWQGADVVFNPEMSGGYGLSSSLGVAAFPSGIVYRVGDPAPTIYLARLFLRQSIGLGGGRVAVEDDMNQLAGTRDRDQLTFIVGRLSIEDTFDGNAYAHDPSSQFFDWALFASGAFDYAADTRGYTWGVLADLAIDWWSVRAGLALEPEYANLQQVQWDLSKARALLAEFEARWSVLGGRGSARLTPWLNQGRMGSYAQVLADPAAYGGQVQPTRADGRIKYGIAFSADQQLTKSLGCFLRASWDDGATETFAFTEIDRSLAAGVVKDGSVLGWKDYELGAAIVVDGLSALHRAYLAQGGYGFIIGDGALNYSPELEGDFYARLQATSWLQLSVIYQPVIDPGYNADRGPIHIFSGRVRLAF